MSDQNLPPKGAPPLPEPYSFPTQLVERWIQIPPQNYIDARLTRQDLDQLFFGLSKAFQANQALMDCLIRWSNNDLTGANEALQEARRKAIEGDNSVRHFFAAIMAAAIGK